MLSFENDYSEGAHEKILQRFMETNLEKVSGYGSDPYCESAKQKIREACECPQADVYFLTGGTQTNAVVISSMLESYEGVVAAQTGHVACHEAGAIEYSGHKVITVPQYKGKIKAEDLKNCLKTFWDDESHEHMVFPGMVYMAAQGDHYLAVYAYNDGQLSTILEQSYEQYLVEDITGGGSQDLILMSTQEDGGVQIELLTVDKEGGFRQAAVMGLSADRFSGCASVAAGLGSDRRNYLVLDGWTGISGNNLASVLLCFDESTQQMVQASQISADELYEASLRNVSTLVSCDLDGDGIVEIPTQPDEAGLLNLSQSRRMDFIVWMDYTSRRPEKSFGLLDEETNCYIELPTEWEGNLKLTDSEQYDGAVELRTVDEDQPVMTVRLAQTAASSTGWTKLGIVASRQMQARLAPDVEIQDADYSLSNALYLLN